MYYEEEIIGGILMCRTTPNGAWEYCSVEKLTAKIVALHTKLISIQEAFGVYEETGFDEQLHDAINGEDK